MRALRTRLVVLALLAATTAAARAQEGVKITSDTFGGLQARALGPAVMSGRIAAIDAVPTAPLTIYVGSASGGVWKSADGGTTFKPIFDKEVQSIGAVRVDPTDPKIVWVGTGESWARNSVSVGDGVYRSGDGGDTWQKLGLADSERIARIQVDSKAHDTVYVCATGHLWNANTERGVYKTTDAGKTWERVLFVDEDTGCADLAIDPQDPRVLYAGMWQFRRYPDFFYSGGKGSGLYRSRDGGKTWERLHEGLPAGELGRIGVAVAPSRPSTVYALVESKKTALFRSDDFGHSWTEVNSGLNVQVRPFYFAHVVVDPTDFDTVYKPGLGLGISKDGGKSFSGGFGFGAGPHGDHHALWIHPQNPKHLLLGTDGGLYWSVDQGNHWVMARNLPVSQFYRVAYDLEVPYNVYGGLQDNSSWVGPSRSMAGVENKDWMSLSGGDGFWTFPDPRDANTIYTETQGGEITRVDKATGEVKSIKPFPGRGESDLRFNWNAAMHLSPNEPGTLYIGAQYLYRSRDRGDSWEKISPDLTTNDPARQRQKQSGGINVDNSSAENNATIYAISESPRNRDLVWVGTDDGNLQLTRDGGRSWSNVVGNVPGLPKNAWVSSVEASPHAEAVAYATFDHHRTGNMKTYVFKTADHGASWQALATPEIEGYAWVIRQDPVNPSLLYLGTEFGLYLSLDDGRQWARFTGGLPKVAVHDLAIHPREGDLVIGTHGRGIYILDDLTPIRALTAATLAKDIAVLPSRVAERTIEASVGGWFGGSDEFVGDNPPEAASIVYWLKKRHLFGDLKVEIYDRDGKLLSTVPGGKRVGLNRVYWPMRLPPPKMPPSTNLAFAFTGPRMPEGVYAAKLIKGKETIDFQVELVADPRSRQTPEDRAAQQVTALGLYRDLERLTWISDAAAGARKAALERAGKLGKDGLGRRLERLATTLGGFVDSLAATSEAGWLSGDIRLREKMGNLFGDVNRYEGRPTAAQMQTAAIVRQDLAEAEARFQALQAKDLETANAELRKRKLEPIAVPAFEEWKKSQEAGAAGAGAAVRDPKIAAQWARILGDRVALRWR